MQNRIKEKTQVDNEAHGKEGAEEGWNESTVFDIDTGKQAPLKRNKQQKAKISDKRKVDLPPPLLAKRNKQEKTQIIDMVEASGASAEPHSLLMALAAAAVMTDLSILNPVTPSLALDKTLSAASNDSAPILPSVSHSLPTALIDKSLISGPASTSDAFASGIVDLSEKVPTQKKNPKREAVREVYRKAKAERRWKHFKLFDINTGKQAPKGASQSEQYLPFYTYVRRHVKYTQIANTTYVKVKTGEPAPGITSETYQRGQHTTLYNWQLSQKTAEFSKILNKGGNLPLLKKAKPNVHSFFKSKQADRVGPASKKEKTMPSAGSAEHPLPVVGAPHLTSEASFIPSLSKK